MQPVINESFFSLAAFLQALALSLQTEGCTSSAALEEGIATSTVPPESTAIEVETTSDPLSAEVSEDDEDDQDQMVAVDSTCREDVEDIEDLEDDEDVDGTQDHEGDEAEGGGVGGGAALGHVALTRKWRPPNLRVLSMHVSLSKISVRLPMDCKEASVNETQTLLEILDLNITLDGFLRLPLAERRCLDRLRGGSTTQIAEIAETAAVAGFSGSCLLTWCSLQLVVLDSARHPLIQARPLHLRLCCTKRAPSCCPELHADVCIQSVELFPQPLVFVAVAGLQNLVVAVNQARDAAGHVFPSTTSSPPVRESTNLPRFHVELVIRDARIRLTPAPSLSLSLLLPSLRAVAGEATDGLLPLPPPNGGVAGISGTATLRSDADWHVYGCLGTCSNEAESKSLANWETLVTERQWSEGLQEAVAKKRLLLRRNEFLRLSASKLKAFEQTQLQDRIAEEQHALSLTAIAKATDDRFYDLLAGLSEGFEAFEAELQAQLEELRVELRALDEFRRKDEVELRDCEREASTGLTTALQDLREHELQQQLEEEKRASEALQQLVATQDLIIQGLTTGGI